MGADRAQIGAKRYCQAGFSPTIDRKSPIDGRNTRNHRRIRCNTVAETTFS
jgi:hypothetical protein